MDVAALLLGTRVLIVGLQARKDLNGRHGTVCGAFDEAKGRVPISIELAKPGDCEDVLVKPANLQIGEAERRFKVVRTQCTMGNTGRGGLLPELIGQLLYSQGQSDDSPLVVQEMTRGKLEDTIRRRGWVEHPTELCGQFGLSLLCFSKLYESDDEHRGRNNILATYLTNSAQTGLAPNTVLGEAIFVRLSPSTGELVDFVRSEAMRALCYLNDLSDVYPLEESCPSGAERASFFDAIKQCFPYYMANGKGSDTMRVNGFSSYDGQAARVGCWRMPDGTLRKPANLQPDAEFVKVV